MKPDLPERIPGIFGTTEVAATTKRLCEIAAAITGVTGAGVMLFSDEGQTSSLAATDEVAATIESLQSSLNEGPGIDAYLLDEPITEGDLANPDVARWSAFTPQALRSGVRAVFGFPMRVGAERLGSLDLYRDRAGTLDDQQHANALVLASSIANALLAVRAGAPADVLEYTLEEHAGFADVVHQACGMVSVQLGVSVTEALTELRAYAARTGRLVIDVAADVVNRQLRIGDADSPP